jgi:hypothetical protein
MSFYREQYLAEFGSKVESKHGEVENQEQMVRALAGQHCSNDELCTALHQLIAATLECQRLELLRQEIEETLADVD